MNIHRQIVLTSSTPFATAQSLRDIAAMIENEDTTHRGDLIVSFDTQGRVQLQADIVFSPKEIPAVWASR